MGAGRVFCGVFCPGGSLQDLLFKIPIRKIRLPQNLDSRLRHLKYFFTILVIFLIIEATRLWTGLPLISDFWSFLIIHTKRLRIILIASAVIFLGLAPFIGRSWCRYFCPLGTWISVFNKYSLLERTDNPDKCLACHLCHQRCSAGLNPLSGSWRSLECVRCLQCYSECRAKVFEFQLGGR